MPHVLEYDEKKRRIRIDYHGQVDVQEYFTVIEELEPFDTASGDLDGMSVFLGAEVDIDPKEVQQVLERLDERRQFRGRNWAFVIEDPRQVAIGLLYQMAARGVHAVQVFGDVEAATRWLDGSRGKRR